MLRRRTGRFDVMCVFRKSLVIPGSLFITVVKKKCFDYNISRKIGWLSVVSIPERRMEICVRYHSLFQMKFF